MKKVLGTADELGDKRHRTRKTLSFLDQTNAEEVATEMFDEAKLSLEKLQRFLTEMKAELEGRKSGAFSIQWVITMNEHCFSINNQIARGNGAVLVRSSRHKR